MSRRARLRKRIRREDDVEELVEKLAEQEEEQQPKAAVQQTPVDRALELQKTAGNRAVASVLQRRPLDVAAETPVADWPKHAEAVFDDELVVPIESVQDTHEGHRRPPSKREGEEGELAFGELVIHTQTGKQSAELHKALLAAKRFAKVEIVIPGAGGGVRIILTNVLITGVSMSEGGESWSLSFEKREFTRDPRPRE
jgi:hypothetical protein